MYDGHSGQGQCQGLAIVGIHINVGVTVKPLSDCAHIDPDEHSGQGECQDSAGVGIYVNVSIKVIPLSMQAAKYPAQFLWTSVSE